jgi:uncharacterized protein
MDLNGKRIVITGAGSGIGRALTALLIKYDVEILAIDINIKGVLKNSKIEPYLCDVSNPKAIDKLFDHAIKKGGIDIFIANAGFPYYEVIDIPDWDHITKIFATNVFSPVYACEAMKIRCKEKPYLVVINASAMAELSMPGYALYSSTKAAAASFADGYRFEPGNKNKIMTVYPIATHTNFFSKAGSEVPVPFPIQTPEKVAKAIVQGVLKNKKKVYPSFLFSTISILNRFIPFLLDIYTAFEKRKLVKWYEQKKLMSGTAPGKKGS